MNRQIGVLSTETIQHNTHNTTHNTIQHTTHKTQHNTTQHNTTQHNSQGLVLLLI